MRAVEVIKAVEMTPQGVDPQNKASLYEAGVLVRLAIGEVITPFAEACDALDRALSLSMAGVRLYPASTTAIRRAVPPQQSTWAWLREQERSEQEEAA